MNARGSVIKAPAVQAKIVGNAPALANIGAYISHAIEPIMVPIPSIQEPNEEMPTDIRDPMSPAEVIPDGPVFSSMAPIPTKVPHHSVVNHPTR
jgi:hypothetical protein